MLETDAIDFDEQAKLCWLELRQRLEFSSEEGASESALASDARHQLKVYMQEAVEYLGGLTGGYNPLYHATASAKRAIREYAKSLFLGHEPTTSQSYMSSEQAWRRAAAVDFQRSKYD